jgi:L-lactate utilization protein LutC
MSARDDILNNLRRALERPDLRFPPPDPEPLTTVHRMSVTEAEGDPPALAARFGQELDALHGSHEIASSTVMARMALINRIQTWMEKEEASRKGQRLETGQERSILAWNAEQLPLPGLAPALADLELTLATPEDLRPDAVRAEVRYIRYGLSGVEAAFASTGSMLMASSAAGTNRAASLLPLHHIALIPFSRLYPTIEAWLSAQRRRGELADFMHDHANVTMISGPSKSADIEGNLTLGVHGPKFVHAILFDDAAG